MPPRRDEKSLSLGRYLPLILCLAAAAATALSSPRPLWLWAVLAVAGALTLLGLYDLAQRSHSVRRNYPDHRQFPLAVRVRSVPRSGNI